MNQVGWKEFFEITKKTFETRGKIQPQFLSSASELKANEPLDLKLNYLVGNAEAEVEIGGHFKLLPLVDDRDNHGLKEELMKFVVMTLLQNAATMALGKFYWVLNAEC